MNNKIYTDRYGNSFQYINNVKVPIQGNANNFNNQNNNKQWDGFKRSGFEVINKDDKIFAYGWKATKGGLLKFKFNEDTKKNTHGKIASGKNKGEEWIYGVLSIINTTSLTEIIEPTCIFQRKNGEYYLTSKKLGLICTTVGQGKTKSGKVSKGAIVRMK